MLLDDFSNGNKRVISKKYVVYLDGKPATYHENLRDAEGDIYDIKQVLPKVKTEIKQEICYDETINKSQSYVAETLDENLKQWFKEKWVRFGPDGKIRGGCARGDSSEGKPKCLPQAKAHALGKKGRKYAASKKRREDPNPERSGAAINVATKKKTSEDLLESTVLEACWKGYHREGNKKMFGKTYPNCVKNTNESVSNKLSASNIRRIQNHLNQKYGANLDVDGVLGPLTIQSIQKFIPSSKKKLAPEPDKNTAIQGKKSKEGVAESRDSAYPLNWSLLDEGLSVEDKIYIFEEYFTKGNLIESIDIDKKDYLLSLTKLSDTPLKNKMYIVASLALVGNRTIILDKPGYMKFLGVAPDGLIFKNSNGRKVTYPSKTMRDLSVFNTFTFSSEDKYDKFRTALSLKFNTHLPDIDIEEKGKQGVAEGNLKEFAPTKFVGNINRGGGGSGGDGGGSGDDRNERDDSDDEGIINKILQSLEGLNPDPFETYGGEVEDVVVDIVSGGRLDDLIRAVGMGNMSMKDLVKQGVIETLKELRELYGDQGVAEGTLKEFASNPRDDDEGGDDKKGDDGFELPIKQFVGDARLAWAKREPVSPFPRGEVFTGKVYIMWDREKIEVIWYLDPKNKQEREQRYIKNYKERYPNKEVPLWYDTTGFTYRYVTKWTLVPAKEPGGWPLILDQQGNDRKQDVMDHAMDWIYQIIQKDGDGRHFVEKRQGLSEGGPFSYGAKKPRPGSVADLAAKQRLKQEKGKQPIEPRDQMVGTARVTKGVAEGLDDFHRKLAQQIKDRIARSQTNLALTKAQHPELWQWEPGDQVYSKKTGKTYTIKGLSLNQKNEPMYNYQRGEDEESENFERGRFIADKAHKDLIKLTETIMAENPNKSDTVSIQDLNALLNFSKQEKQLGNVKKLEQEIRARQSAVQEGEVIHQRFGQGKKRSTFRKNPDINIPHYDPKRMTVYHPDYPGRGEPESFANFQVEPSKYSNVFKIIGITKDNNKVQVSTTTSKDLADALVDAYLRGGYTDTDIERVELPKQNAPIIKKPNLQLVKTDESLCPKCGGPIVELAQLNEKKDSCYYKVRSRYKVWPSAYASGALVQCRKKGAKNWGNKSESISEDSPPTSATIDPNFHTAIRDIESNNNSRAVSRKGARGTMQVMPKTLRNPGYGVLPAQNNSPAELERVGKDYFNAMLDKYGGDKRMALIAYNMGPVATDRWASQGSDFNQLPKETQGYVPKVFNRYTDLTQTNLPQTSSTPAPVTTATIGTTGTTAPITQTSVQQTAQTTATAQNALLGKSVLPKLPSADSKTLEESGKHYFKIPQSLCNDNLREQFQFRHDHKGWYLRESQQNFKKLYLNATKAFTALEGFDLSKGNGSAPTQGDDIVTSPVGSIPKAQRKNAKKIH